MEGQIIKIISNKYYVQVDDEVIVCFARGKLRNMQLLLFVGDYVIIDKNKKVIENVLPRKNKIRRPPVSNITQALIVTSFNNPEFSENLIDKLLIELETNKIKPKIVLTKLDLISETEYKKYENIINYYNNLGYTVYKNTELEELKKIFKNETTVLIGQTGSGKSTLLNKLNQDLNLKTGEVSKALGRGRHTTRHIEIIEMFGGKLLDTPGFSALEFNNLTKNQVRDAFIEFRKYPCEYKDCMHDKESECNIIKNVKNGNILVSRYENYLYFLSEALKETEKYKRK